MHSGDCRTDENGDDDDERKMKEQGKKRRKFVVELSGVALEWWWCLLGCLLNKTCRLPTLFRCAVNTWQRRQRQRRRLVHCYQHLNRLPSVRYEACCTVVCVDTVTNWVHLLSGARARANRNLVCVFVISVQTINCQNLQCSSVRSFTLVLFPLLPLPPPLPSACF